MLGRFGHGIFLGALLLGRCPTRGGFLRGRQLLRRWRFFNFTQHVIQIIKAVGRAVFGSGGIRQRVLVSGGRCQRQFGVALGAINRFPNQIRYRNFKFHRTRFADNDVRDQERSGKKESGIATQAGRLFIPHKSTTIEY